MFSVLSVLCGLVESGQKMAAKPKVSLVSLDSLLREGRAGGGREGGIARFGANPLHGSVVVGVGRGYKRRGQRRVRSSHSSNNQASCLDVEREARDSEREEPSAIARCCATTSRASPSPPSAAWLAVVV